MPPARFARASSTSWSASRSASWQRDRQRRRRCRRRYRRSRSKRRRCPGTSHRADAAAAGVSGAAQSPRAARAASPRPGPHSRPSRSREMVRIRERAQTRRGGPCAPTAVPNELGCAPALGLVLATFGRSFCARCSLAGGAAVRTQTDTRRIADRREIRIQVSVFARPCPRSVTAAGGAMTARQTLLPEKDAARRPPEKTCWAVEQDKDGG